MPRKQRTTKGTTAAKGKQPKATPETLPQAVQQRMAWRETILAPQVESKGLKLEDFTVQFPKRGKYAICPVCPKKNKKVNKENEERKFRHESSAVHVAAVEDALGLERGTLTKERASCERCGKSLSRSDAVKRHIDSSVCQRTDDQPVPSTSTLPTPRVLRSRQQKSSTPVTRNKKGTPSVVSPATDARTGKASSLHAPTPTRPTSPLPPAPASSSSWYSSASLPGPSSDPYATAALQLSPPPLHSTRPSTPPPMLRDEQLSPTLDPDLLPPMDAPRSAYGSPPIYWGNFGDTYWDTHPTRFDGLHTDLATYDSWGSAPPTSTHRLPNTVPSWPHGAVVNGSGSSSATWNYGWF